MIHFAMLSTVQMEKLGFSSWWFKSVTSCPIHWCLEENLLFKISFNLKSKDHASVSVTFHNCITLKIYRLSIRCNQWESGIEPMEPILLDDCGKTLKQSVCPVIVNFSSASLIHSYHCHHYLYSYSYVLLLFAMVYCIWKDLVTITLLGISYWVQPSRFSSQFLWINASSVSESFLSLRDLRCLQSDPIVNNKWNLS